MNAVYEISFPRKKVVVAVVSALLFPTYMAISTMWGVSWRTLVAAWWVGPLILLPSLFFLFWAIRSAHRAARPTRFRLEGNMLEVTLGYGIPNPSAVIPAFLKDGILAVDLSEAHVEWAGIALNLRTREFGTLTLGFGEAARPLADWFTAQGHPPVRAY